MFTVIYLMTLIPAVYMAFRRDGDFTTAAIVVLGNWAVGLFAWQTSNPLWTNAVSDALCAAFITRLCFERACLVVALLFWASANISLIYGLSIYPDTKYNSTYAHAISVMGHLQNLALLVGSADDGIRNRIRDVLWAMGRTMAGLGFHRRRADLEDRETD